MEKTEKALRAALEWLEMRECQLREDQKEEGEHAVYLALRKAIGGRA